MARDFPKSTASYCLLGVNAINPLLSGAAGITVQAFVNPDTIDNTDFNNRIFVALMTGASTSGIVLNIAGGPPARARFAIRSESAGTLYTCDGATTLSTGSWLLITGVADIAGDNMAIYVQGVSDATASTAFTSSTFTPSTPTGNDSIGCVVGAGGTAPSATGPQFDGRISHLAIWNAKLSAPEIYGMYRGDSPLSVRPGNLVAYYGMNNADGSIIQNLVGGSKHGTITGTIPWAPGPPVRPDWSGQDWPPFVSPATGGLVRMVGPRFGLVRPYGLVG